jgi:hypothetical protein
MGKKPTGISFVVANEHEIVQDLKSAGTKIFAEL